jgi:hypothetical protein
MNELGLQTEVASFEGLFKSYESLLKMSERLYIGGNQMVCTLCELYAMMGAYRIRVCIDSTDEIEIAPDHEKTGNQFSAQHRLPSHEAVQKAARELFVAVSTVDKAGMLRALEEMGVLALCPIPEQQFSRMELVAGCVTGRARLVPLVELSFFAAELGDYWRATKYALEARAFDPSAWELYKVCVVEGLVALNAGKIGEAVQCLSRSMSACQTDEYASVECSVRAPLLVLAEKLLERGERVEVLRHLLQCQDVWQFLRPQIEEWITVIERGERLEFQAAECLLPMNQPSVRLKAQWMSACSLQEGSESTAPKSTTPKSRAAVLAGRERLRAVYRRYKDEALRHELGRSDT